MELRGAKKTDYRAIRSMLKAGVEEGSLKPRTKKDIKQNLRRFVVAEEGDQLIGMVSFVVYDRRLAEVRSLYVTPEYRGNGLGKKLVRRVIEQPVKELPSATIFAITSSPQLFEADGYSSQQGQRHILFKNI